MRPILIEKRRLVETLTANRAKHLAAYLEAADGYRTEAIAFYEQALRDAPTAAVQAIPRGLPPSMVMPVSYVADYDRALRMLDFAIDNQIELDEDAFRNLVMDEWQWTERFAASNSLYHGKARR